MAEKKKTAVKKDTTKRTVAEIESTLAEKRNDLIEARRSHAAGELVNPRALSATRKEIARLLTELNAEKSKAKNTATKEEK